MNDAVRRELLDLCMACVGELVVSDDTKTACTLALQELSHYEDGGIDHDELLRRIGGSLSTGDATESIDDCLEQAVYEIAAMPKKSFDDENARDTLDLLSEAFDRVWHASRGLEYKE